jgi:uncharacterized protein (TIGR02996 family)
MARSSWTQGSRVIAYPEQPPGSPPEDGLAEKPMTDNALFEAILDSPDDGALRLVFADWLEEHGESERAEFVRLQIQLADPSAEHGGRPDLRLRERELLHRHHRTWAGDVAELASGWEFRRGFVEAVTLEAPAFLERAEEVRRLAPVRAVEVRVTAGEIASLAESPALRLFPELYLHITVGRLDRDGMLALTASSHLLGVTALGFRHTVLPLGESDVLRAWLAWPVLLRLTALALNNCHLGSYDIVEPLLSAGLPCLARLDLRGSDLGDAGVQRLVESSVFPRLVALDLRDNWLEDRALVALALCPRPAALVALDLSGNSLGQEDGVEALPGAAPLSELRHLDLSGNLVRPAEWRRLLAAPALTRLTSLGLSHQRCVEGPGDRPMKVGRCPSRLALLDVSGNGDLLRVDDVQALLDAPSLRGTTLFFSPRAYHSRGSRNSDFTLHWQRELGGELTGPFACPRDERHDPDVLDRHHWEASLFHRWDAPRFSSDLDGWPHEGRPACSLLIRRGEGVFRGRRRDGPRS